MPMTSPDLSILKFFCDEQTKATFSRVNFSSRKKNDIHDTNKQIPSLLRHHINMFNSSIVIIKKTYVPLRDIDSNADLHLKKIYTNSKFVFKYKIF